MKKIFLKRILALFLICALLAGGLSAAAETTGQSEVSVNYGAVAAFKTGDDFAGYLEKLISDLGGREPSDAAKAELATYVETAASALAAISVEVVSNQLTVTGDDIRGSAAAAENIKVRLEGILAEAGITVNKTIAVCLNIEAAGFDMSSPGQVTFDSGIPADMGSAQSIRIFLGDNRHSIAGTAGSLREIAGASGKVIVRFQQTGFKKLAINILDGDGNEIEKLPAALSFTMPANSKLATVLATYSEGVDNWGGQYDASNGAIEFSTRYSGTYEVLEDSVSISDIRSLGGEEQSVITFMVSKGYFTLSEDAFAPGQSLTKYDFITALVKMFFALDRETATSFSDVPAGSAYYAYVASAQTEGIAKGDETGKFNGDKSITVQEVVALCARTLAEKEGYSYPEDPGAYLNYSDSGDIGSWARQDVALAAREGLISDRGALNPGGAMTRAESALILYRLFMLLYETSPIAFEAGAGQEAAAAAAQTGNTAAAAAEDDEGPGLGAIMDTLVKVLAAAAIVGLLACAYMLFTKKSLTRKKKKRRR